MSEPVTLFYEIRPASLGEPRWSHWRTHDTDHEYRALPAAEFDALKAERDAAAAKVRREALEDAAEACRLVLAAERNIGEDARSGYDGYRLGARACCGEIHSMLYRAPAAAPRETAPAPSSPPAPSRVEVTQGTRLYAAARAMAACPGEDGLTCGWDDLDGDQQRHLIGLAAVAVQAYLDAAEDEDAKEVDR